MFCLSGGRRGDHCNGDVSVLNATGWNTYTGQTANLVLCIFYHNAKRSKFPNPFLLARPPQRAQWEGLSCKAAPGLKQSHGFLKWGKRPDVLTEHEISGELPAERVGTARCGNLIVHLHRASLPHGTSGTKPRKPSKTLCSDYSNFCSVSLYFEPLPLDALKLIQTDFPQFE